MKEQKLNIFGETDDIKQALYSSWCEVEEALIMIAQREANLRCGYACENTELEFLAILTNQLTEAREVIDDFAPEYYREPLEGWAQGAAEMSHP